tara:strand:+ start:122 stop:484 length:363 start_codon:yes stop_codon:yes gene_type:complete
MSKEIIILILLIIIVYLFYKYKKRSQKKTSLIKRFKANLKSKSHIQRRAAESINNALMSDPNKNISLTNCDKETELREKADIHRSRLKKFGKSKINNELLFLGPQGGIYKLTTDGKKKYI